jgi:hypothetical protein
MSFPDLGPPQLPSSSLHLASLALHTSFASAVPAMSEYTVCRLRSSPHRYRSRHSKQKPDAPRA